MKGKFLKVALSAMACAVFIGFLWGNRYQRIGPAHEGAYVYDRLTGRICWLLGNKIVKVSENPEPPRLELQDDLRGRHVAPSAPSGY